MLSDVVDLLRCPHCGGFLRVTDGSLGCPAGHNFDIAKQGHVNLMGHAPGQNADTAEMVAARLRVLQSGLFDPLTRALAQAVDEGCGSAPVVVDAGAGPGHHLGQVVAGLGGRGVACDVSALACRRAAKVPSVGAVVADTWAGLPVGSGVADAVLSVFAPRNWRDFARMSRGIVVVAAPRPGHLRTIRSELNLLQIDDDKLQQMDQRAAAAGLQRTGTIDVEASQSVAPEVVADLVQMGPNAFHQRSPGPERSRTAELLVRVATYRRS